MCLLLNLTMRVSRKTSISIRISSIREPNTLKIISNLLVASDPGSYVLISFEPGSCGPVQGLNSICDIHVYTFIMM